MWKLLSQGIHMCNMKALLLLVWKLWPRLMFFKSRLKFKVKVTMSNIKVLCERSCRKEYTCAIWKPCHFWFESFFKSRSNFKVKVKYYGTMWKVLSQGLVNVQYESPITSGLKVMAKVKVFVHAHMPKRTLGQWHTLLGHICPGSLKTGLCLRWQHISLTLSSLTTFCLIPSLSWCFSNLAWHLIYSWSRITIN